MTVKQRAKLGKRDRRHRDVSQRLYGIESALEAAIDRAREFAGKNEIQDMALAVTQDPVADRDSFRNQENRAATFSFADNLPAGSNRSADRIQVEQAGNFPREGRQRWR